MRVRACACVCVCVRVLHARVIYAWPCLPVHRYIEELARNVSASGVPTMRPLWYEFPQDTGSYGINDQYVSMR